MAFDAFYAGDAFVTPRATFSNGNLTAAGGSFSPAYGNSNPALVQTTQGKSAGKWYFEITVQGSASNNVAAIGVAPCMGNLQGFGLGFNASPSGFGYFPTNGKCFVDSTEFAVGSTYGVGDVISIALDCGNKRIWCRKNGGAWCGTLGPNGIADPATNTQGFDLSASLTAGRVFAAAQMVDTGGQVTANFGASSFAQSVPSGFGGWTVASPNVFGSLYVDEVGAVGALPAGAVNVEVGPWIAPGAGGSITSVIGVPTIAQGSVGSQMVIYDDTGGQYSGHGPGALLGASNQNTALALGENVYTFSTPVHFTAGQRLWIGVLMAPGASTYTAYNNNLTALKTAHQTMTLGSPASTFGSSLLDSNVRVPVMMAFTPDPPAGGSKNTMVICG